MDVNGGTDLRLIDADAELKEAKKLAGPQTGDGWDNWGVYALIERQPTIDAVPVVRCKDCKWWKELEDVEGIKFCTYTIDASYARHSFDYCSNGERKDDGNN